MRISRGFAVPFAVVACVAAASRPQPSPDAECTVVIARVGYYRQQHDIILSSTRPETLDVALRRSRRSVY